MKKILLSNGEFAIMDDEDFPVLNRFKWQYYHNDTKKRERVQTNFKGVFVDMGDFLFDRNDSKYRLFELTHVNNNGLDYRKENLHFMSRAERRQSSRLRNDNSAGYKGVWIHKKTQKAFAEICKDGQRIRLGYFETPELAALAYNQKAREPYGESAYQNII